MFIKQNNLAVLIVLLFVSGQAMAVDVSVRITGVIHIPPCSVNNDRVIEVDFKDILVTDVNSGSVRKKIDVPIVCSYSQGDAYVKVTGSQLGSNSNVLATNITNFGIALYQGNGTSTKLVLGEGGNSIGHRITTGFSNNTFTFTAVPFKSTFSRLKAGAFKATANMSISYL